MSIQYKVSNLLSLTSGIIVHGCNNQGIMGGGVAAAIKDKWPACYETYRKQWDEIEDYRNSVKYSVISIVEIAKALTPDHSVGDIIWWHETTEEPETEGAKLLSELRDAEGPYSTGLIVANAITQEGFGTRRDTDYNAIDEVFEEVFNYAYENGDNEIHIPLIGSGIGGANWAVVEAIILDRQEHHDARQPKHPHQYSYEFGRTIDVIVHCLDTDAIPSWRTETKDEKAA